MKTTKKPRAEKAHIKNGPVRRVPPQAAGARMTCSLVPKPPIGLRPRWIAEEQRMEEIAAAMIRYNDAGKDVPAAWTEELAHLVCGAERRRAWLAVSFGGGTNSTAMLCGMRERVLRPDFIAFADTGAEYPHTYEHVAMMAAQVKAWWNVELLTVRKTYQGRFEGLEGQCNRHKKMPSISYGRRSCSVKYKHEPQTRALKAAMKAAGITHAIKAIGFDAGEGHRVREEHLVVQSLNKMQTVQNWYPLVEWGWARAECVEAIKRHGLPQPGKSSCYFCGAMKKREVYALRDQYPELLARALKIEDDAQTTNRTNRGLGGERNLWRNWLNQDAAQSKLWDDVEPVHVPCGCYDGTGCDLPANTEGSRAP